MILYSIWNWPVSFWIRSRVWTGREVSESGSCTQGCPGFLIGYTNSHYNKTKKSIKDVNARNMQLTTNNVDILCQITVNICSGEIDLMNRWGSEGEHVWICRFHSWHFNWDLTFPKSSSNSGGHSCIRLSISGMGLKKYTRLLLEKMTYRCYVLHFSACSWLVHISACLV